MIDILYFAWLRERIGTGARAGRDRGRDRGRSGRGVARADERYAAAFADTGARSAPPSIRSSWTSTPPLSGVREVAFFPPMTGG